MAHERTGFAKKLVLLREQAGISQYELAKRSGVSKQAISKLEAGTREPSWKTVQALVKALGVSCEALVDQAESVPPKRPQPRKNRRAKGAREEPNRRRNPL